MRAHPKPSAETVRAALPNWRYCTADSNGLAQRIPLEIVGEAIGRACRNGHYGKCRVRFYAGGEAACVHHRHIIDIVQPVPSIQRSVLRGGVHAYRAAKMRRPARSKVVGGSRQRGLNPRHGKNFAKPLMARIDSFLNLTAKDEADVEHRQTESISLIRVKADKFVVCQNGRYERYVAIS